MSARPRWRDAAQIVASLTNAERASLNTLISVPLAEVKLLQQLDALDGGAAVYRRIARLREAGLVAELRPPLQPGRGPGVLYLTDLGIAAIALLWQADPTDLAGGFRVRGADLRGRMPGLAVLHACHRLLGALAAAGPGWPHLLAWEQPFRRRFRRPTAKALVRLTLPAYASLAWDDRGAGYLLLPDLGKSQLRAYRPLLHRLDALRRAIGDAPRLIIAADDWRVDDWLDLHDAVARARGSAPIPAWIARWSSLETDLEALMDHHPPGTRETDPWIRRLGLKPFKPRRLDAPIPKLVGDLMAPPAKAEPTMVRLGRLVLTLKPSDYRLLEIVAHHPFLPADRLAVVLRWETRRVRERIAGLRRHGLIRQFDPSETGGVKAEDLWELTADGLRLVAARIGLPFPVAVRANGLAGGGPEEEIGRRRNLIRYLAHTRGADDVFISLIRLTDLFNEQGGDDELIEWQGPAACAHGLMRPDGYGEYRRAGKVYAFYLEYDRGTTSRRDYFEKFTSYYKHVERRRFERDYHGCPIILVVTTSPSAEKRIAESLRTVSRGYPFELRALLTCEGLGIVSRYNPEGLLGPIWRDAWSTERRYWLPPSHVVSTEAPT